MYPWLTWSLPLTFKVLHHLMDVDCLASASKTLYFLVIMHNSITSCSGMTVTDDHQTAREKSENSSYWALEFELVLQIIGLQSFVSFNFVVIGCVFAFVFVFVFSFWFFETGFLCATALAGCPGIHFVDQASLRLTEIHLPLPPEYWD